MTTVGLTPPAMESGSPPEPPPDSGATSSVLPGARTASMSAVIDAYLDALRELDALKRD